MAGTAATPNTDQSSGGDDGSRPEADRRDLVDRLGDRSVAMTQTAIRNPAVTVALGTVVLFLIARIPAEMFYSRLGLDPEEVGLTSIEIFVQGIATILAISLAVAVVYGIALPIFQVVYFRLVLWPIRKSLPALRRRSRLPDQYWALFERLLTWSGGGRGRPAFQRILRLGPLVITVLTLVLASVILVVAAIRDSDAIRNGDDLRELSPWQAKKVKVVWTTSSAPIRLPNCDWLYYLGEGGGRVALYNAKTESIYRLSGESVQLAFPAHC